MSTVLIFQPAARIVYKHVQECMQFLINEPGGIGSMPLWLYFMEYLKFSSVISRKYRKIGFARRYCVLNEIRT